jgi:hypothetical protein
MWFTVHVHPGPGRGGVCGRIPPDLVRSVRGAVKSGSERLAELRARRRKEGLRPFEVWAHPDDQPAIKRYVERLAKRRDCTSTDRVNTGVARVESL